MAELLQLDKAASLVGKSEVTLRRLIKAGKIPFQKEKTLTGFIYMVDPDHVRTYYQAREGSIFDESLPIVHTQADEAPRSSSPVRVAVAGESGAAHEYWQKKSERYEERYHEELLKHAQTREELGIWRGRAEQSQAMLMKLLPASHEVEVRQPAPHANRQPAEASKVKKEGDSSLWVTVVAILILLVVLLAGAATLLFLHGGLH